MNKMGIFKTESPKKTVTKGEKKKAVILSISGSALATFLLGYLVMLSFLGLGSYYGLWGSVLIFTVWVITAIKVKGLLEKRFGIKRAVAATVLAGTPLVLSLLFYLVVLIWRIDGFSANQVSDGVRGPLTVFYSLTLLVCAMILVFCLILSCFYDYVRERKENEL